MIFGKLKFLLLFAAFVSLSVIADDRTELDKNIDLIKEFQAVIEYEKKGIKRLMIELKELDKNSPRRESLKKLLAKKHKELNHKIGDLNELVRAVSHNAESVSAKEIILKEKTLDELEDEIGIDREISAVKKKINETYKDFVQTPSHEEWQKKKKDYFRVEEQKKKIILVE